MLVKCAILNDAMIVLIHFSSYILLSNDIEKNVYK